MNSGLSAHIATEAALVQTLTDDSATQEAIRQVINALLPVTQP